jgi:hypothetical protein
MGLTGHFHQCFEYIIGIQGLKLFMYVYVLKYFSHLDGCVFTYVTGTIVLLCVDSCKVFKYYIILLLLLFVLLKVYLHVHLALH